MKKWIFFLIIIFVTYLIFKPTSVTASQANWWNFRSIDTMKYSRDVAREKLKDSSFKSVIDQQVKAIADTGASHVAIATPYDEEFYPFLKSWVDSARKHDLNVWFRGNFSGWEGWFGYEKISRSQHLQKTREFIEENDNLFRDGDVFTACPECENGGPGDPRFNGDADGHRKFLIDEHTLTADLFRKKGKKVQTNFNSMNGDVANLIMDKETTKSLGGLVVIDHYVNTPTKLANDIVSLANKSGGKIILGEFGAPIPDINGDLTEDEQAAWIKEALEKLVPLTELEGLSYWVNTGGSTELWDYSGKPRKVVSVLTSFYKPKTYQLIVRGRFKKPIAGVTTHYLNRNFVSDRMGLINIPHFENENIVKLSVSNYTDQTLQLDENISTIEVELENSHNSLLDRLVDLLYRIFGR